MPEQQPRQPQQQDRGIAVISAELAEVERHLVDIPPHHGGGRADLSARADALRRELAAARAAHRQQQEAQQQ